MADLDDLLELRTRVDELRREADRADGAYSEALRRLQTEFGCDSIEQAEKRLAKLKTEELRAAEEFDAELQTFKEKWAEELGDE